MPFLDSAKAFTETLPKGGVERCIMDFLMKRAVGRQHAVTWGQIEEHIIQQGHLASKNAFQQNLLKLTREGDVFIGSSDNGVRGYFLISDYEDALVMVNWYRKRMATEARHLDHLVNLMDHKFPMSEHVQSA